MWRSSRLPDARRPRARLSKQASERLRFHLLDQPHLQKSRVAKVHNSKPQSGQHQLMEHGYSVLVPTAMNDSSCVFMHATTEATIAQAKLKVQTRQASEHTSNLLARNRKAFSCQVHQYPTASEGTDVCCPSESWSSHKRWRSTSSIYGTSLSGRLPKDHDLHVCKYLWYANRIDFCRRLSTPLCRHTYSLP